MTLSKTDSTILWKVDQPAAGGKFWDSGGVPNLISTFFDTKNALSVLKYPRNAVPTAPR